MATYSVPKVAAHGFIVIDLETDGLIPSTRDADNNNKMPQILQIGFAPLEKLAHPMNVVSYYTQPIDTEEFLFNRSKTPILQKMYKGYSYGHYSVKDTNTSEVKNIQAYSLKDCVNKFIAWKQKLYGDQPVFLVAHNGIRFDKVILDYNLLKQDLLTYMQSELNLVGWIDSLQVIRELPNILILLGYGLPRKMTQSDFIYIIKHEQPFGLGKLMKALCASYEELGVAQKKLEWPIFDLSLLQRSEEDEEWQHYFSKEAMIHSYKFLVHKLTLHRSADDVMALICIIHQLNLYPLFKKMAL